jgi:hypothetical protein
MGEDSTALPLSVLVVTHTGNDLHEAQVRAHLREAARQLADVGGELVVVAAAPMERLPAGTRLLLKPELGYYGQKNAALEAARGNVAVFLDGDCRLSEGYLAHVVERFCAEPDLEILAGRTAYAGESFLTRVNTCLSFGYFFDPRITHLGAKPLLANNFAVRRASAPRPLFGPWLGRVKGDEYATQFFAKRGHPPPLDPRLLVFHADPSRSLPDLIERHLREHLSRIRDPQALWPLSLSAVRLLRNVARSGRWRAELLRSYGPFLGLSKMRRLAARAVVAAYTVLDLLCVGTLVVWPPLARRWFRYQEHAHAANQGS